MQFKTNESLKESTLKNKLNNDSNSYAVYAQPGDDDVDSAESSFREVASPTSTGYSAGYSARSSMSSQSSRDKTMVVREDESDSIVHHVIDISNTYERRPLLHESKQYAYSNNSIETPGDSTGGKCCVVI